MEGNHIFLIHKTAEIRHALIQDPPSLAGPISLMLQLHKSNQLKENTKQTKFGDRD